jgi:hypothetical protein
LAKSASSLGKLHALQQSVTHQLADGRGERGASDAGSGGKLGGGDAWALADNVQYQLPIRATTSARRPHVPRWSPRSWCAGLPQGLFGVSEALVLLGARAKLVAASCDLSDHSVEQVSHGAPPRTNG